MTTQRIDDPVSTLRGHINMVQTLTGTIAADTTAGYYDSVEQLLKYVSTRSETDVQLLVSQLRYEAEVWDETKESAIVPTFLDAAKYLEGGQGGAGLLLTIWQLERFSKQREGSHVDLSELVTKAASALKCLPQYRGLTVATRLRSVIADLETNALGKSSTTEELRAILDALTVPDHSEFNVAGTTAANWTSREGGEAAYSAMTRTEQEIFTEVLNAALWSTEVKSWATQDGGRVKISEMTPAHRGNVLRMLERNVAKLVSAKLRAWWLAGEPEGDVAADLHHRQAEELKTESASAIVAGTPFGTALLRLGTDTDSPRPGLEPAATPAMIAHARDLHDKQRLEEVLDSLDAEFAAEGFFYNS